MFSSSFSSFSSFSGILAKKSYDLAVIGGGPGGYVAAIKAGQLGLKTVCIEKRGTLGGTCLNVGCIPSKALLNASHKYHDSQHEFKKWGLELKPNSVNVNVTQMMKQKDKAVSGLTKGIEFLFKKNGVDYVKGEASFKDDHTIAVAKSADEIEAKNIIIATGSDVASLPFLPINDEEGKIISSTGALSMKKVPKKMIVIGAGVIGLEMGSVWSRLGAKVEVIEYADKAAPFLDGEIAKQFQTIMTKQGLKFTCSTKVTGCEKTATGVKLSCVDMKKNANIVAEADVVLVAIGRKPYIEKLGAEKLGIKMDKMGRVEIDDKFRTNLPHIYAIGDVVRGPMLAHKAEEEGIAAVENIKGLHGHVNYNAIPSVIYTWPEVAAVGMTEEECKEKGIKYKVGKFPFSANSRAKTNDDADGMVKFITEAATDKILGCHMLGPNVSEMIMEATIGIEYGASSEDIARVCHCHPCLCEAVKEAALAAHFKAIHA